MSKSGLTKNLGFIKLFYEHKNTGKNTEIVKIMGVYKGIFVC